MQNLGFSDLIIRWYRAHKRDLPWRRTTDPYHIWLSEIILQQTRVDQGMGYYNRILEAFPTVELLAAASEDQLLKLWQGLGYYSRARNMHATAVWIQTHNQGRFPDSYVGLLALKGVGPYTAAAVASFCYKEAVAVVDGNVERVLTRYYGIESPVDDTATKREIRELAQELISKRQPDIHNQAIMEFGALQCVPKSPVCERCVLVESCVARRLERVNQLPYKAKSTKIKDVYIEYIVLTNGSEMAFRKRENVGIWSKLHDFHAIESDAPISANLLQKEIKKWGIALGSEPQITHLLSHRRLHIGFTWVRTHQKLSNTGMIWQKFADWDKLAVPRPVHAFLEQTDWKKFS